MLKIKALKLIFLLILLFCSKTQYAQGGLNNPYSRFGLGEMMYSDIHPYNGSMGGLAYTVRKPNMINPFNPASYTRIDTCSFVFDIGFQGEFYTLKDNVDQVKSNRANFSHILFGFPIFKWWKTSIGLLPVSDIEFASVQSMAYDPVIGTEKLVFEGTGGLSKVYLGNAFEIFRNFSFGFNVNFIFGNIYYASSAVFPDSANYYNSRKQQNISVTNFSGDVGLQYYIPVKEKYKLGMGLTYAIPSKFDVDVSEFIYTYKGSNNVEVFYDSVSFSKNEAPVKLPQSIGLGFSFEKDRKWFVGADVTYTNWSDFVFINKNSSLSDNLRFSLGGNFTPDERADSYLKRISYRAGFHYENNKLNLENENLNDFGVHIGFGLPLRRRSCINVHLEYGKFGTTEKGLVQKDYFKLGISLSASDIWFVKSKYD